MRVVSSKFFTLIVALLASSWCNAFVRPHGGALTRPQLVHASTLDANAETIAESDGGGGMVKSGENVRGFFKQFCEAPIGSSNNQALGKLRDLGVSTLDTIKSSKTGLPTGKAEAWRHTNLRNLFPSERYYGGATTNNNIIFFLFL